MQQFYEIDQSKAEFLDLHESRNMPVNCNNNTNNNINNYM